MKRSVLIGLFLVAGVLAGFWMLRAPSLESNQASRPEASNTASVEHVATGISATIVPTSGPVEPGTTKLIGETILEGYATTNLPPENDLTLMARLMENSLLLLKSAGNRPLSANEDWADLLRGRNAAAERFLPDRHVSLNTKGQLVDRWRTPLFFHALGGGRHELRSAGPDGKLWNDDDLHRNADGSFRRGAQLNPDSLLEGSVRR